MQEIENLSPDPEESENIEAVEETPLDETTPSPSEDQPAELYPITGDEDQVLSEEVPEPAEEIHEKKEETKVRKFFRKLIRWTAGLLIIFGLGLVAGIFMLYRPATKETQQVRDDLAAANTQIENLQSKISELEAHNAYLQSLEDDNTDLLNQQQYFNLHIAILDARLDVSNASLALNENDLAQAKIILDRTSKTLDSIEFYLEPDFSDVVESMRQRLKLVLGEMENDPYAAQSDLDVLATNLLQLEDSLFTE
jgi:hypothetical protein